MLYVKKNLSLKTPIKEIVFKNIKSIKKRSEDSSRNVCSADLEDSLGKEELYLRKIKKNWCLRLLYNVAIMFIQLLDHKDKLFANIHFYVKTRSNINIQDTWTCWH